MAMLKQLDFVAITDHNSAKQLQTVRDIETAYDFIFIPGIEVTVNEGFDVLCYFRTYEQVLEFDEYVEEYLNVDNWGPFHKDSQIITDVYDMEKEIYPKSLMTTHLPYDDLYKKVKELRGIAILAHIERSYKSALLYCSLDDIPFDGIEIQPYRKAEYLQEHPQYKKYKMLSNSDSHTLLSILEREEYLELPEKSIDAFFDYFEGSDNNE